MSVKLYIRCRIYPDPISTTACAAEQLEKNRDFLQQDNWIIASQGAFTDSSCTVADLLSDVTGTHKTLSRCM